MNLNKKCLNTIKKYTFVYISHIYIIQFVKFAIVINSKASIRNSYLLKYAPMNLDKTFLGHKIMIVNRIHTNFGYYELIN